MNKEDYEKMLEELYTKMPKKSITKERFEIPVLDLFIQGNKSICKNFYQACDKIRRSPEVVSKYLSKELAAPISLSEGRMVISGKINQKLLNEKFTDFVKEFVICNQCGKPDTNIIEEKHFYFLVCEACGSKKSVRNPNFK
ncbi:MAG: translation initiation factor IF-2 subunit beta [Candidatus Micrarchaeota archaeon]|nr:translation initiation factor IF-2 subunit beta [Candidatus Micrarchaeota archaeon]